MNKNIACSSNGELVQSLLNAMQEVIKKHGLNLMQTYPGDLLVHDNAALQWMAFPGSVIAWMVGHCHTHICQLGLHPKENQLVDCMTNLSSEDRFYTIQIHNGGKFSLNEVDRKAFAALSSTTVPYVRQGSGSDFWLLRHKSKVGYISLKNVGTMQQAKVAATITPVAGISGLDRAALNLWCTNAIVELAGTLFVLSEVTWSEPLKMAEAA